MVTASEGLLKRGIPALFFLLFCAVTALPMQGRGRVDKEALISGVRRHYDALKRTPNLVVKYQLKHEHVGGAKRFAFTEADLVNATRDGCYRTELRYKMESKARGESRERFCTWNGSVGMDIVENPKVVSIRNRPDTLTFHYRFYFDYLGYPEGSALLAKFHSLSAGEKDYWLPEVLEKNAAAYRLLEAREPIDGDECYLLERSGYDKLWIDPERGFMLRRRDVFFPGTSDLRERIVLGDEERIEDLWLPKKIHRDLFGGLDESPEWRNKVTNRFTVTVRQISTDPLPDSYFLLPVTDGMMVHDKVRGMTYKKLTASDDPISTALEQAQKVEPEQRGHLYLIVAILGLLIVIFFVGRHAYRLRSASSSSGGSATP